MRLFAVFALFLFSSGFSPLFRIEAGKSLGDISRLLLPSSVQSSIRRIVPLAAVSQATDSVEITGFYVKVYKSPDKNSSVVVLAEQGQRFHIQGRQGAWFQIRVMDNPGWVSSKEAKIYDPAAQTKTVTEKPQPPKDSIPQPSQEPNTGVVSDRNQPVRSESGVSTKQAPESRNTSSSSREALPGRQRSSTRQSLSKSQPSDQNPENSEEPRSRAENNSAHSSNRQSNTTATRSDREVEDASSLPGDETDTDSLREETNRDDLSAPIDPSRVGSLESRAYEENLAGTEDKTFGENLRAFGAYVLASIQHFLTVVAEKSSSLIASFSSPKTSDNLSEETPSNRRRQPPEAHDEEQWVQIIQGPVRVLQELNPESPILGMANRGAHFRLINYGDSWVKIVYKNKEGWVERRYLNIVEAPSSIIFKDFLWLLVGIVALIIIFFVVRLILSRFDKVRNEWFESVAVEKKILLVARNEKSIQRYLTNSPTTLQKTFSELGFTINIAPTIQDVHRILTHFLPDFIAVDWEMQQNVFPAVEHILTSRASSANLAALFYNVPSPENAPRSRKLPNAHYFGTLFNDRDIFRLVTPLISREPSNKQSIQKSVEEAALTGDVADGSLAEVFQFAEISRKTGCLLLEDKKPFGLVFFKDGIIIYAATRKNVARDAIFDILNLEDGRFRFVLNKKPQNSNCKIPTLGILMEWTKEIDEANGR